MRTSAVGNRRLQVQIPQIVKVFFVLFFLLIFFCFSLFVGLIRDYSGLKIWREKKFSLSQMGERLSQSSERFSFNVLFFHILVRFFLPLGHFQ